MKNLFLCIFASLLVMGCKEEPKRTNYIINGTAKGVYNGVRVHLNSIDEKGKDRLVKTQMIVNEQFTFEGEMQTPSLYNITVNSIPGKLPFMLENSEINININKGRILSSEITGSKSQKKFETYKTGLNNIEKEILPVRTAMRNARLQKNTAKQDSILKRLEVLNNKKTQYTLDFIDSNKDNFFSLFIIGEELKKTNLDIEKYMEAFNNLSSTVQTSRDGVAAKLRLEKLYRAYTKTTSLEIGKVAPNFEAPNADGEMVALNDLKGKVTIIDFWAAWCGPCRRENPNVVKIYNEYHSKGLEIIGVSLDGSRGQKDPKKAWLDAVKKDKLTWPQVSYLQYFNDPVAQLYNINSIPATYVLDKDGKIAAKNLRGNALRLKVEELLQK
ncbi:redoxin domain-containing protein [Winogradskyella sp.]|uniref:redoxin domain-containing protein n=1 Tax=Winogradskyella sp. TaxID=1883156 RepID=UPI003AB4EF67